MWLAEAVDLSTLRRKAGTAALMAFRYTPEPLKKAVVRIASPSYVAGAVCVLEHDGEVLVLWQPHRRGWSLPGGFMDKGEEPADAVRREVMEEVGLRIDPGDPVTVRVDAQGQGIDVIFRVVLDQRPDLALATEARKAQWVVPGELREADRNTLAILGMLDDLARPRRQGRLRP